MRILVVGSGGREHAIVWSLARFGHRIWCAPGNAGIGRLAQRVSIAADDSAGLAEFARNEAIDLTIVGPEAPLCAGIADEFSRRGLALFGPNAAAARLEGDKRFAKELMEQAGIPTARFAAFTDVDSAVNYVEQGKSPVVVKAAGLAAGKGVVVATSRTMAVAAVRAMLVDGQFGSAGRTVVIEEYLEGEEASLMAFCDGRQVLPMLPAQDHKRLADGDCGPNTGGMGAYAPAPVVTSSIVEQVRATVFEPLLATLTRQGIEYRGVIYAGLMLTASGPRVLEFNCRFGDPETQGVLPLLQTDLAELATACVEGRLSRMSARWSTRSALCVVAAASGYPGMYPRGMPISGDDVGTDDVIVFHAGTEMQGGKVVANGGRVLGVTGIGDTLLQARERAYAALSRVRFDGMVYRTDIGVRGLAFKP